MKLAHKDQALLDGREGAGAQFAMELLVQFAEAVGAPELIDTESVHVDGCIYKGQASLDFVEAFVQRKGKVRVPTTLNTGSINLCAPHGYFGPSDLKAASTRLMLAYAELGGQPTFTCAPYQTIYRPRFGQQIAWGESNAIVFANSVIGARTNRYGDFLDLCCAMTGRVPYYGLHLVENRRAQIAVEVDVDVSAMDRQVLCVVVGHIVGKQCGNRIPAIIGLPASLTDDDLKALGAVAASAGSVALFHVVGRTPEAKTLDEACQNVRPQEVITIGEREFEDTLRHLSTVDDGSPLRAVSLGTPHYSLQEFEQLLPMLKAPRAAVDVYISTGRQVFSELQSLGMVAPLEAWGVTLIVDACTYNSPSMREGAGPVMTNSGKWAYYAPNNLGIETAFGSTAECVVSAQAGRVVRL
ncbi:MAG: aconitase X catalytic domain-containing protein [Proteobacteria bacterium]|nr:aconitase X catalytic domain-containing protein [Pseudomonadota bacterium]